MPTSPWLMVIGWALGWWLFGRPGRLPAATGAGSPIAIDVVIPARNEAEQLPRLLDALGRQSLPPRLVVVVDDESEDGTGEAARIGGAHVLEAGPTPVGWTGKSWACWQGARAGSSDVIVFLDADTDPQPDLLERAAAEHARRGGLISVQPFHRMKQLRERLAAVFNIIGVMGVGCGPPDRGPRRTVGAFGPCLVTSRADYLAVGGHEAIAASVIDDFALAHRFASQGLPVQAYIGQGSIEFRMYPTGTRALVEGFAKNFASGAGNIPATRTAAIAVWVAALLSPMLMLVGAVAGGPLLGALGFVAAVVQVHSILRQLGNFGVVTALLYPVALVAFVAVFAWSIVRFFDGTVTWKGRTLSVRRAPG